MRSQLEARYCLKKGKKAYVSPLAGGKLQSSLSAHKVFYSRRKVPK